MSTCCGPAGRGVASVSLWGPGLGPHPLSFAPLRPSPALLPWEGSLSPAHLVFSCHGPAPLQEHVLDTADGGPGGLSVPEQSRGARGCPVGGGVEKARPERWEATEGPIREEPQSLCQPSHLGLG